MLNNVSNSKLHLLSLAFGCCFPPSTTLPLRPFDGDTPDRGDTGTDSCPARGERRAHCVAVSCAVVVGWGEGGELRVVGTEGGRWGEEEVEEGVECGVDEVWTRRLEGTER